MNIIGTGSALPKFAVTNQMLAKFLDTTHEWILSRTGIRQRRILTREKLEDLAVRAAQHALEDAGIAATDLDYIICSNVINEFVTPALSCRVQGRLGAQCPCLDVNGACAGFIYALDMAQMYLLQERYTNILIIAAEEPTRMVDWKDRRTCVLFGDGAGAVVLTKGNDMKAIRLSTQSKIDSLYEQQKLYTTPFLEHEVQDKPLYMNGQEVFRLAVSASVNDIKDVLSKSSLTSEQVDHYLLHQANIRIIESVRQALKAEKEKFHQNIERYGNTSSASIPILLDELNKNHLIKKGDALVFSAFGAGFTTGACLLYWSKEQKKSA